MVEGKHVLLNGPETKGKEQTEEYQPVVYRTRGHYAFMFVTCV
jgi:hypothetical protein